MIPTTPSTATPTQAEVERVKPLFRGIQIVWAFVAIVDIILFLRFILKALAANDAAGFTQFIYLVSTPFAYPFVYVFNLAVVDNSVIEWGTLLAILIYTLIGAGIVKLLAMSKPVTSVEADHELRQQ